MDLIELIGYFIGFWLFLFNKKFRAIIISDWNSSGMFGKFFIVLGAVSSVFCGVVLPVWFIQFIVFG